MRPLRVSEDIVPVSQFKAHASDWLKRCEATGQAIVITQNGKAAGVLVAPAVFDDLGERRRFVAAVEDGLRNADAGRLSDHATVVAELRSRYRGSRKR